MNPLLTSKNIDNELNTKEDNIKRKSNIISNVSLDSDEIDSIHRLSFKNYVLKNAGMNIQQSMSSLSEESSLSPSSSTKRKFDQIPKALKMQSQVLKGKNPEEIKIKREIHDDLNEYRKSLLYIEGGIIQQHKQPATKINRIYKASNCNLRSKEYYQIKNEPALNDEKKLTEIRNKRNKYLENIKNLEKRRQNEETKLNNLYNISNYGDSNSMFAGVCNGRNSLKSFGFNIKPSEYTLKVDYDEEKNVEQNSKTAIKKDIKPIIREIPNIFENKENMENLNDNKENLSEIVGNIGKSSRIIITNDNTKFNTDIQTSEKGKETSENPLKNEEKVDKETIENDLKDKEISKEIDSDLNIFKTSGIDKQDKLIFPLDREKLTDIISNNNITSIKDDTDRKSFITNKTHNFNIGEISKEISKDTSENKGKNEEIIEKRKRQHLELAKRIKALEEEIEESRKNNSLFSSPVSYGNNKAKSVYNTSINLISKKEIDENNNTEEENIDTKTMTNINHNNIHTKNAKEESPFLHNRTFSSNVTTRYTKTPVMKSHVVSSLLEKTDKNEGKTNDLTVGNGGRRSVKTQYFTIYSNRNSKIGNDENDGDVMQNNNKEVKIVNKPSDSVKRQSNISSINSNRYDDEDEQLEEKTNKNKTNGELNLNLEDNFEGNFSLENRNKTNRNKYIRKICVDNNNTYFNRENQREKYFRNEGDFNGTVNSVLYKRNINRFTKNNNGENSGNFNMIQDGSSSYMEEYLKLEKQIKEKANRNYNKLINLNLNYNINLQNKRNNLKENSNQNFIKYPLERKRIYNNPTNQNKPLFSYNYNGENNRLKQMDISHKRFLALKKTSIGPQRNLKIDYHGENPIFSNADNNSNKYINYDYFRNYRGNNGYYENDEDNYGSRINVYYRNDYNKGSGQNNYGIDNDYSRYKDLNKTDYFLKRKSEGLNRDYNYNNNIKSKTQINFNKKPACFSESIMNQTNKRNKSEEINERNNKIIKNLKPYLSYKFVKKPQPTTLLVPPSPKVYTTTKKEGNTIITTVTTKTYQIIDERTYQMLVNKDNSSINEVKHKSNKYHK